MLMPSVYTILFLEECPLRCRYCDMRQQPTYMQDTPFTKEQLFEAVDKIVENHPTNNPIRILFTGGEPLLRWEWIREVILKYRTKLQYGFNTSGYLITKEMLEFLKHYEVQWVLSVDGGRRISMYQRPTENGKNDYWDTVEKIFPTLLYYFPHTRWKSILSRKLIPHMAEIWMEAERQGFRQVWFVRDFGDQERNYNSEAGCERKVLNTEWTDEDWMQVAEQYSIIAENMFLGMENNSVRTFETKMLEQLQTLLVPEDQRDKMLSCGVFAGRGMKSMYSIDKKIQGSCLHGIEENREKSLKQLEKEIVNPGKCPKDPECLFFYGCTKFGCIKDNHDSTKDYFAPPDEECRMNKIAGNAALWFLNACNESLSDNEFYQDFLYELQKGGKIYGN